MLTETEIRREIRTAETEKTLTAGNYGKGAGVLRLRIRPGSRAVSAVWVASWKQAGQRGLKQLGRYPEISLADARRKYEDEIAPLLMAGKRPKALPAGDGKPTVERMFKAYTDSMRHKGRSSADEVERVLLGCRENAADALGRHRLASEIDADEVVAFVSTFYKRGKRGLADKARSYICSAFNWALKAGHDYTVNTRQDWGVKFNPAALIPKDKGAVKARERNLSDKELVELWKATEPGRDGFALETAACIRILIATGQRVREALRVEGSEIDLDAAMWNMPAEKTKLKLRPHKVPLPPIIMPTLRALKKKHGQGPLFPSRVGDEGEIMHDNSVRRSITRWLNSEGVTVEHFQTRDLRRTWKSRAGEIGISKEMRDLIQQHARNDIGSKHYDWGDYLPRMREAMNQWGQHLERLVRV